MMTRRPSYQLAAEGLVLWARTGGWPEPRAGRGWCSAPPRQDRGSGRRLDRSQSKSLGCKLVSHSDPRRMGSLCEGEGRGRAEVMARSPQRTVLKGDSAGWICTTDLQIMSLVSFCFSTAQSGLLDLNQHFPGYLAHSAVMAGSTPTNTSSRRHKPTQHDGFRQLSCGICVGFDAGLRRMEGLHPNISLEWRAPRSHTEYGM